MSGTISSSVAARGTMWANSCPLSRWQPLRMPAHVVVQRATAHNQVRSLDLHQWHSLQCSDVDNVRLDQVKVIHFHTAGPHYCTVGVSLGLSTPLARSTVRMSTFCIVTVLFLLHLIGHSALQYSREYKLSIQ